MMMFSLFEMFDPLMSSFSMNLSVIFFIALIPLIYKIYMKSSRNQTLNNNLKTYMMSELKAAISNKNNKINMLMLYSFFLLTLMLNLFGMIPYTYTLTSQIMFTFSLALPIWLSIVLFNMFQNTNHFISHLVPLSTPMALSHFMTIIESISLLIRPITLSVRLGANMTAGHILMALASSSILMFNFMSLPLSMLLILELAVAFIQSYVFTMLLSMYLSEVE